MKTKSKKNTRIPGPTVVGRTNPKAKARSLRILFFGEAPGREEARQGTAFAGPSGKLLQHFLDHEFPADAWWLDNVCPEILGGGQQKPATKDLAFWADYRMQLIQRHQPRVICLLGDFAKKAFGFHGQITRLHAKNVGVFSYKDSAGKDQKIPCVCSLHPAWFLRNPYDFYRMEFVARAIRAALRSPPLEGYSLNGGPEALTKFFAENPTSENTPLAVDLETTGLSVAENVLSIALAGKKTSTAIALNHPDAPAAHAKFMGPLIERWWAASPFVVVHNAKFDTRFLPPHKMPERVYDTLLMAWLIDENSPKSLKYLATQHLGIGVDYYSHLNPEQLVEAPLDDLLRYNVTDAILTQKLFLALRPKLSGAQWSLLQTVLFPLAQLLGRMERRGIFLNLSEMFEQKKTTKNTIEKLQIKLSKKFPGVNFGSAKQVAALLSRFGLETKRTKKGQFSTSKKELAGFPVFADVTKWRLARSYLTRFLEPLERFSNGSNYVYTTYSLGYVRTGRISSSNPNLQNLNREGDARKIFQSQWLYGSLVQGDYAQHELRCIAGIAEETNMQTAFLAGLDLHEETRKNLKARFRVDVSRDTAKNINFSLIYGITPEGLLAKYDIPLVVGRQVRAAWFQLYPGIVTYHAKVLALLRQDRIAENPMGFIRHLPDHKSLHARNQALNHGVQSFAAFVVYMAMLEVERKLEAEKLKTLLVHQVLDSIILDSPKEEVETAVTILRETMERQQKEILQRWSINVYLKADIKVGRDLSFSS